MSVNKVILIGRVGQDPAIKKFEIGQIASFSLATSERAFKTQNGIEVPERTEWHNIIVRGGLAVVVEKYVKKGSELYLEGKLRNRSYEHGGVTKYITEVYIDNLQMLGGKPQENQEQQNQTTKDKPAAYHTEQQPDVPQDDLPF